MNKISRLLQKLRNKDYREAFVSARVAAAVGSQISALRQKVGWRQSELAERAGMKQSRISLLEKADYENFSFNTLRRIATALDVAVIVQFVSFPEFVRWSDSFTSENLAPEPFETTAFQTVAAPPQEGGSKALEQLLAAVNQNLQNENVQLALTRPQAPSGNSMNRHSGGLILVPQKKPQLFSGLNG